MKELVFSILIFTIITSVLKCLIIKEEYTQYFQFFCGLIMILLVLDPVIKFFGAGNDFYSILNEHIYSDEVKDSVSELKNVEGKFKETVVTQCEKKIERQIRQMAEKNNVACVGVELKTRTSGDKFEIEGVVINTKKGAVAAYSNNLKKSISLTKNEKRLKKDICDNYLLNGEEVQIWK